MKRKILAIVFLCLVGLMTSAFGSEAQDQDIASLIKLLRSNDGDVRIYAATRLGKKGPAAKDAVPALTIALTDRVTTHLVSQPLKMMRDE